jgi:predicted permease
MVSLRQTLRRLGNSAAFTVTSLLTLAVGIGATTAIFSVVYSVLIKPLPYPNADELVRIRHPQAGVDVSFDSASSNMYLTYREENSTLASVGLWQETDATLNDGRVAERVRVLRVTDGTLQALGVPPMLGRQFVEAEHGPAAEAPTPVILSYAFWQRRFGGDAAAIGKEISVESARTRGTLPLAQSSQVVGIMPPDFRFLNMTPPPDIILPVRLDPASQNHGFFYWQMLARLKPGVTLGAARADLERMRPIWLDAWPAFFSMTAAYIANLGIVPVIHPLRNDLVGGVASMLWVLMGAIVAVLLIACANVANLMLVRADARRSEFAVRSALGAVPSRIARELLGESFVLGAAGSVMGLVLAYAGLRVLVAVAPSNLPRLHEIAIYPPVLAFTVVVSLASTLVFGSIAALKYARHTHAPALGAVRGFSAGRERIATRNTLVVVQVALALMLVVSAALMFRTFQALRDVDPGFSDPSTIQTARIWVPTTLFPEAETYTRMEHEIVDRISALPGVASVGFASELPMEASQGNGPVAVEGQAPTGGGAPPSRRWKFVSPGYFESMGTQVISGRAMTWADIEAGGQVAVISEDFAREIATEPAAAIGKRIRLALAEGDTWREVIGVVQRVHEDGLQQAPPATVYWPVLSENMFNGPVTGTPSATFVIRSERAGTASLVEEIRQAVRSVSASIPVSREQRMQDLYAGSLERTSFALALIGIAGAMALALGVIGIYGVIAYVVSQRARELGIRAALGARPQQLVSMFVRQGLALAGVGATVGLIGAVGLSRLMSSLLFGISPIDPVAFCVALGVTITAAALASYLPARRATTIAPTDALRAE